MFHFAAKAVILYKDTASVLGSAVANLVSSFSPSIQFGVSSVSHHWLRSGLKTSSLLLVLHYLIPDLGNFLNVALDTVTQDDMKRLFSLKTITVAALSRHVSRKADFDNLRLLNIYF